ncbi:glycosyltransferase, partial [candidate division KSB1 bacterium]
MAKKKLYKKGAASHQQKQKRDKENKIQNAVSVSLIIAIDNNAKELPLLLESIEKLSETTLSQIEIIISDNDSKDNSIEILENNRLIKDLIEKQVLFIIKNDTRLNKPAILKAAMDNATKHYISVININYLNKVLDLNEIISVKKETLLQNPLITFLFKGQKKTTRTASINSPIILLNNKTAQYLFNELITSKTDFRSAVSYRAKQLEIPLKTVGINQENPYNKKILNKRNVFPRCISWFLNFIDWFFILPLKELKTKPQQHFPFIKESSIFRFLFAAIIVIFFFLIPRMSYDAGISGDEFTIYKQAEKVLKFYQTSGADTSATFSKTIDPMHLYGISFDV